MKALEPFVQFLEKSPTTFHAAKEIIKSLTESGFIPLSEKDKWSLQPGKSYFVCRDASLVAAFRVPHKTPKSATLLASHLDSPCLKIKPRPEQTSHGIGQLGTEIYGAPILHSWLDRNLVIAGRICALNAKGKAQSFLVRLDEHPVIIPQLALHLDRSAPDKGFFVHKQDHLKPIFALKSKENHFEDLLRKHYSFKTLLGCDLFLVPAERPAFLGHAKELIAAYRLDNLTSVYAALFAMKNSSAQTDVLQAAFFWDHEEIGSMSYVGADSCFADQLLERICICLKMTREDYFRFKSYSICLSGDLAHGLHPNFLEKYDLQNAPILGGGPILKFNANQKYATSSSTAASIASLAKKHKLPLQKFASRSDIPSGSTVGSMMAAQLGIRTVDLGIAGWAMHSARETISTQDEQALCMLFKAALEDALPVED